jgi:hypothetical protein
VVNSGRKTRFSEGRLKALLQVFELIRLKAVHQPVSLEGGETDVGSAAMGAVFAARHIQTPGERIVNAVYSVQQIEFLFDGHRAPHCKNILSHYR